MVPPEDLFVAKSIKDKRLLNRTKSVVAICVEKPGLPYSAQWEVLGDATAAYRLVENPRMSFDKVIVPAAEELGRLVAKREWPGTLLNVQDTTEILTVMEKGREFGPIGNPLNVGDFLHSSHLVTLGIIEARSWARDPPPEDETPAAKKRRRKQEASRLAGEKESARWFETIQRAETRVGVPGLLLHVADRECDIFNVFARAGEEQSRARLLIRAAQDRRPKGEHQRLWETAEAWKTSAPRSVDIPARPARPGRAAQRARTARVVVSYGKVCILAPPKREPDAPATAKVELTAVLARELNPPSGVEPVEWMLLTNDRIKLIADAWLRVEWYRHRWVIEVFHKALKSGQQIEERLYEHRRHRGVALAICMLAAAHIVWLSLQARLTPGLPASKVLSADEVLALATLEGTPVKKLTLGKALERIGRLGGHHARTNDGPLGWMRLWRGYAELAARIVGARQLGAAFVRADAPLG